MTAPLVRLGELARPASAVGSLAVEGALAYLSRGPDVAVIDLGDPRAPRVIATVALPAASGHLAVRGARAFVATTAGVDELDVARPAAPRRVRTVMTGDSFDDVGFAGEHLVVSDGEQVRIWDVGASPREVGACDAALARRVTVVGDLVFVAADCEGMFIVDVADRAKPRTIGGFEGPGDVTRVAVSEGRAYLADYSGGIAVVDVGDPRRPRALARWDEGMVGDVAARGTTAYAAMGDLVVIDFSRPARPRVRGRHSVRAGDTAWNLAITDDAVLTLGAGGLTIWGLGQSQTSQPE